MKVVCILLLCPDLIWGDILLTQTIFLLQLLYNAKFSVNTEKAGRMGFRAFSRNLLAKVSVLQRLFNLNFVV
jgi:hypothetical protein